VRIAHLSDLHLLSLEGAVPFRIFNKRLTGYMNIRLRRGSIHKAHLVRAAARAIRQLKIDHVVVTGDVSNLALETEFELVRSFLETDLGLGPDRVSMVPGNHDTYTRGAFRSKRFYRYFGPFLRSDLPELSGSAPFPFVRLRGPAAIIGLSTAVPRLPFVASGALGRTQLDSLARILGHPEVRRRTPILLQHHPFHSHESWVKSVLEGLRDAPRLAPLLTGLERGMLLHGHLHRRIHRTIPTEKGHIDSVGATSASLVHASDERMAGFNVYEIDDEGGAIGLITSHCFDPQTESFREVVIPRG
jgi:3',5'-cyclic AMP phosphodiesterase CpdA